MPGRGLTARRVRWLQVVLTAASLTAVTVLVGANLAGASSTGPRATGTLAAIARARSTGKSTNAGREHMVRAPGLAAGPVAGSATYLGAEPATSTLRLDVVLAPSNGEQLAQLVSEVSSPASSLYHHYLTEQQFAARFGPPSWAVREAESWLRSDGLAVSLSSPFLISAVGSAGAASRTLGVQFGRYKTAAGVTGVVASGPPLLPSDLAGGEVTGVVGLNTLDRPEDLAARPALGGGQAPLAGGLVAPAAGMPKAAGGPAPLVSPPTACSAATTAAGDDDSYTADELATNYELNDLEVDGQDGAGVTVALPEINASSSTDVSTYKTCFGLSNTVSVVDVDGGPAANSADLGEADLDIEMTATLVPDASIVAYESPDTNTGFLDDVSDIVTADTAKVISISLGECEGASGASSLAGSMHDMMEEAATQGQSVVVASGDQGSEECFQYSSGEASGTGLYVDYPASDPLVTAAGGTVLTANGELAWNDCNGTGSITCAEDLVRSGNTTSDGASGGGVSELFSSGPSGQPVVSGTAGYREVPDVASESGSNYGADVVLYVSSDGGWGAWLGTSLAAPLWAALVADRDSVCTSSTGNFDTELYSLYNDNYSSAAFNEVADGYDPSTFAPEAGSNDYTQTNGGKFPTGAGYNMVTGLGSPVAPGLACSEVVGSYSGQAGQTVTLDGLGLENASILFGGTAAEVVPGPASATEMNVVVPPGSGEVAVSAEGGLGQSSVTGTFTYSGGTTTTTSAATTTTTAPTTTTTVPTTTTTGPTTTTTSTTTTTAPTTTTTAATTTTTHAATTTTTAPTTTTTAATTTTTVPTTTTTSAAITTTTAPSTTTTATTGGGGGSLGGGGLGGGGVTTTTASPTTTTTGSTTTTTAAGTTTTTPPSTTTTTAAVTKGKSGQPSGYWLVSADGDVYKFGTASYHGSLSGERTHVEDIVGIAPAPGGGGYLMAGSDGMVYNFGSAKKHGSLPGQGIHVHDIVGIASAPSGGGYWLVAKDGAVYNFGTAKYHGSLLSQKVDNIVAIASSPSGHGYWLVSSKGTVSPFGDAKKLGSLAASDNVSDIVGIAVTPDGGGYWLVGRNGAVYKFGDAISHGSLSGKGRSNVVGIAATVDGAGYWLVSANGAVANFGDAAPYGSKGTKGTTIVGVTAP